MLIYNLVSNLQMSRPKGAPSARDAIDSLLLILSRNGAPKIGAEVLRQAKHDVADAATPMWQFLRALLRAFVRLSLPRSVVDGVKVGFALLGYPSLELLTLNVETGRSRPLVLALGWLLAELDLPERLDPVKTDLSASSPSLPLDRFDLDHPTPSADDEFPHPDDLKRLQWELGKLNFAWRKMAEAQEYRVNLSHRCNSVTKGKGLTSSDRHPSTVEAVTLATPGDYAKNASRLDEELRYLKAWTIWKEGGGGVFWDWMESVLEAEQRESSGVSEEASSEEPYTTTELFSSRVLPTLGEAMKDSIRSFHDLLRDEEPWIKEALTLAESDAPTATEADERVALEYLNDLSVRSEIESKRRLFVGSKFVGEEKLSFAVSGEDGDKATLKEMTARSLESLKRLRGEKAKLTREFDAFEKLNFFLVLPPLMTNDRTF